MTPRPYLSHSQLTLLNQSNEKYMERYFDNVPGRTNRGQAFGKVVADSLENDEDTGDLDLDLIISELPKFENRDVELRMSIKTGNIPLLIKMDSHKTDLTAFKEYKTGPKGAWNQRKVDEDKQITFYATGIYAQTSKIPSDIELIHIETKIGEDGRIKATGTMTRYRTQRRISQILNMMVEMRRAWALINKLFDERLA